MIKTKLIIPILVIFFCQLVIAQTKVIVPDTNFKIFLNTEYPTFMDAGGDSLIADSAATLTDTLDCSNQNIADLTGVEYFINITELWCSDNQLTSLPDLSANTKLSYLNCGANQLTSLPDLSANTVLAELRCYVNQLTSLTDLSANTALRRLNCSGNQLTSLPDLSANTALSELWCFNNQLTSLPDLSANMALLKVGCSDNQITSLPDLSANSELNYLNLSGNLLTSLDVSGCIALQELNLSYMPGLNEVCIWVMPFPPVGISIDIEDSPNVYFTTDCMVNISNAYEEDNTIIIYPNPNNGIFNISIDIEQTENIELKILNNLGQEIFLEEIKQVKGTYMRQLNLNQDLAGIYFLQIISVNGVIIKQIIIE